MQPDPVPSNAADLLGKPVGIRLRHVTRVHRMGDVAVQALRGVSFDIAPGEFVALVGASGSGKSTLLSLIGGLDRPTSGEIEAAGVEIQKLSDRALADYRLRLVGTVFQTFNLVQTLSGQDNVALPMALGGVSRNERSERSARLLGVVDLKERARFRPSRMSGGEQQRVAVARALAMRPGLLLADEPTGNLDSVAGAKVLELIDELHKAGATVVMVTHNPGVAARADRIITIKDGLIESDTAPHEGVAEPPAAAARPSRLGSLEAFAFGAASVRRRKLRTALSSAGVAIGIVAMTLIGSLANGLQNSLVSAFSQAGQLQVVQVAGGGNGFGPEDPIKHKALDQPAVDLMRQLAHVGDAYGFLAIEGSADLEGTPLPLAVLTSGPPRNSQTPKIFDKFLAAGHYPASDGSDEAVISAATARKAGLSPSQAIGHEIVFKGVYSGYVQPGSGVPPATDQIAIRVRVAAVIKDQGGGGGGASFDSVGVPYLTATRYWQSMAKANHWTADEFRTIFVVADSPGTSDTVRDEVKKLGYPAQSAQDFIKQLQQLLLFLGLALSAFGAIALLVACLGIANTMYTAVLERTREIGILKALGALRSDVRNMFMAEAAMIGALGGVVGVVITFLLSIAGNAIVNNLAQQRGFGLDLNVFELPLWLVAGAIALSTAFSALSGLFPAIRASRLDPVSALRYE